MQSLRHILHLMWLFLATTCTATWIVAAWNGKAAPGAIWLLAVLAVATLIDEIGKRLWLIYPRIRLAMATKPVRLAIASAALICVIAAMSLVAADWWRGRPADGTVWLLAALALAQGAFAAGTIVTDCLWDED